MARLHKEMKGHSVSKESRFLEHLQELLHSSHLPLRVLAEPVIDFDAKKRKLVETTRNKRGVNFILLHIKWLPLMI